ncbi:MAG: hypothetical protein LC781_16000 [Actinobacteria bacterium]|nr:hypothetical protein [Actinomycetota bacterium]
MDTNILRQRSSQEKVPARTPEETPHGCYEGWIYLGFEGEDEHVAVIERVPCRRCNGGER